MIGKKDVTGHGVNSNRKAAGRNRSDGTVTEQHSGRKEA